jgi:hypothetical protein
MYFSMTFVLSEGVQTNYSAISLAEHGSKIVYLYAEPARQSASVMLGSLVCV